MDQAIRGEDHRAAKTVPLAREIGDLAAGLFDQKHSGRDVPPAETKFPESLEATGGDAGEIERSGTVASNAMGAEGKIPVVVNVGASHAFVGGETGAKQAGGQRFDLGNVDGLIVEPGALAAGGGKEFVVDGVIDDTSHQGVALLERDRDAEAGVAVGEICGAVERVNVPAKFRRTFVPRAFLGSDRVVGEILCESLDDGPLGTLVGLGDQIGIALVDDMRWPVKFFAKNLAGFLGDFDGGFEVTFGHKLNTSQIATHSRTMRVSLPLYHSRGFLRSDSGDTVKSLATSRLSDGGCELQPGGVRNSRAVLFMRTPRTRLRPSGARRPELFLDVNSAGSALPKNMPVTPSESADPTKGGGGVNCQLGSGQPLVVSRDKTVAQRTATTGWDRLGL